MISSQASHRALFDAAAAAEIGAGAFTIDDVVHAGSVRACEALGVHEHMGCVRCGAPISVVYATSLGPLGGDCLATLTGDPSTRRRIQRLARSLHSWALDHEAQFRLTPGPDGRTTIERTFLDTGRHRFVATHAGPRAEIIMVLERFGAERGYEAGIFESESEPGTTHVRPRYIHNRKSHTES